MLLRGLTKLVPSMNTRILEASFLYLPSFMTVRNRVVWKWKLDRYCLSLIKKFLNINVIYDTLYIICCVLYIILLSYYIIILYLIVYILHLISYIIFFKCIFLCVHCTFLRIILFMFDRIFRKYITTVLIFVTTLYLDNSYCLINLN